MPCYNDETDSPGHGYAYVSCDMILYEERGNGSGDDVNLTNRGTDGGNSNGSSEFDDDSIWTDDSVSYAGGSSSSDDGGLNKKSMTTAVLGANRAKWLKSLWMKIESRKDIVGGGGERQPCDKRVLPQPVKSILRPPTTYAYVIGMSGLPSKVAVYPKRM